ncbi:MAG: glycosyltransferase family 2 protein, partial [Selenomonadaceae bacterium]|nr:glycosyltransferase family 2 protein [Selenomonadaceae bacterium]
MKTLGDSCKVSVIVPVFNAGDILGETLDSALRNAEALGDAEILVIDDGSTDASLEMASGYAERCPVVKVHALPHQGSGAARNFGLSEARGEYIAFLDADDFYPEDTTLLRLYETAREKDAAICGGSLATCLGEGPWQTEYSFPYDGNVFREEGYMEYADYQYDFAYYRFLYRRDLIQGMQFPDLLRFQDVPFFVEAMIQAGRFYALKEPTYVYRLGHKHVEWTGQKARDVLEGFREVFSVARRMGYQHLCHVAYFQYRDYEWQGIFLRGMRNGEHPHRVFLSWLRLMHGMDKAVLS